MDVRGALVASLACLLLVASPTRSQETADVFTAGIGTVLPAGTIVRNGQRGVQFVVPEGLQAVFLPVDPPVTAVFPQPDAAGLTTGDDIVAFAQDPTNQARLQVNLEREFDFNNPLNSLLAPSAPIVSKWSGALNHTISGEIPSGLVYNTDNQPIQNGKTFSGAYAAKLSREMQTTLIVEVLSANGSRAAVQLRDAVLKTLTPTNTSVTIGSDQYEWFGIQTSTTSVDVDWETLLSGQALWYNRTTRVGIGVPLSYAETISFYPNGTFRWQVVDIPSSHLPAYAYAVQAQTRCDNYTTLATARCSANDLSQTSREVVGVYSTAGACVLLNATSLNNAQEWVEFFGPVDKPMVFPSFPLSYFAPEQYDASQVTPSVFMQGQLWEIKTLENLCQGFGIIDDSESIVGCNDMFSLPA
ncbi:hypothetical protein WJX72_010980 [[Myrmecia] bisecta]|uniref:Uncharacterized protein n=1 Tax=[Myrmecia] bisecta TaxID=41462 RepID=A0AAW1Q7S2_9CHLO